MKPQMGSQLPNSLLLDEGRWSKSQWKQETTQTRGWEDGTGLGPDKSTGCMGQNGGLLSSWALVWFRRKVNKGRVGMAARASVTGRKQGHSAVRLAYKDNQEPTWTHCPNKKYHGLGLCCFWTWPACHSEGIQQDNVTVAAHILKLRRSWAMQQDNHPEHGNKSTAVLSEPNKEYTVL